MKKIKGFLKALRRNYTIVDTAIAAVIVTLLICGIAYSLRGDMVIPADPCEVSLSYTVMSNNGTLMKYYETNTSLYKMYIHNNPAAVNVTYGGLIDFILSDTTDQIPYGDTSFICIDYAVAVHDNAERLNISAGVITCDVNGSKHALNVFNTTDMGLVYIDCTGAGAGGPSHNYDKIARIDGTYHVEPIVNISPYFYVNNINDTVTNVHVYW